MGFGNPLSPAQLAAAIAQTTLTVAGQVTTTPTTSTTPGTDADTLRILDQAGVDALTAADKATPFVIWNTTTGKANYVVNGAVIAPGAQKTQGTYTGDGTTGRKITLPFKPDLVIVQGGTQGGTGGYVGTLTSTDTTYLQGFRLSNPFSTYNEYLVADGFIIGGGAGTGMVLNAGGIAYNYTAYKF